MSKQLRRIGFLADTHSRTADGKDLPDQVLEAFKGVDLIVHLGDVGRKGILDRMEAVAPVWVPAGEYKGYLPAKNAGNTPPVKVLRSASGTTIGMTFNLSQPDKKIKVSDESIDFSAAPLEDLMRRRFGQSVDVVAFGATHRQMEFAHEGILFFNPGSPTLPSDRRDENDLGSVAVLDVSGKKPSVALLRLKKRS